MKKTIVYGLIGVVAMFALSGCASSSPGYVNALMLTKNNEIRGMKTRSVWTGKKNYEKYTGYQDKMNMAYKCSLEFMMHAVATKALENGYPYFSIEFLKGSNKNPLSINSVEKIDRYCAPTYYDSESNLLDAKCYHNGLGQGAPGGIHDVKAYFFKKRNPFIPLWDAKKVLRNIGKDFIDTCWSGDEIAFRKAIEKRYNEFGTEELD